MRFYIYDCNGELFGNPNGYKTHSAAQRFITMNSFKLYCLFDNRKDKTSNLLHQIIAH